MDNPTTTFLQTWRIWELFHGTWVVPQKAFPQSEIQCREFQNTHTHTHPNTRKEHTLTVKGPACPPMGNKVRQFSWKSQRKPWVKCSRLPGWKSVETSNIILPSSWKVGQYKQAEQIIADLTFPLWLVGVLPTWGLESAFLGTWFWNSVQHRRGESHVPTGLCSPT